MSTLRLRREMSPSFQRVYVYMSRVEAEESDGNEDNEDDEEEEDEDDDEEDDDDADSQDKPDKKPAAALPARKTTAQIEAEILAKRKSLKAAKAKAKAAKKKPAASVDDSVDSAPSVPKKILKGRPPMPSKKERGAIPYLKGKIMLSRAKNIFRIWPNRKKPAAEKQVSWGPQAKPTVSTWAAACAKVEAKS